MVGGFYCHFVNIGLLDYSGLGDIALCGLSDKLDEQYAHCSSLQQWLLASVCLPTYPSECFDAAGWATGSTSSL